MASDRDKAILGGSTAQGQPGPAAALTVGAPGPPSCRCIAFRRERRASATGMGPPSPWLTPGHHLGTCPLARCLPGEPAPWGGGATVDLTLLQATPLAVGLRT